MFKLLFFCLFPVMALAQSSCDELYSQRGDGEEKTFAAIKCFEQALETSPNRVEKTINLVRLSYLKFFLAENFRNQKEDLLLESIKLGNTAILLYGVKYSLSEYRKLAEDERKALCEALYTYGLAVARYIDIKGVVEALKRMDDIKKSMNTILRLNEEAIAFHGAHRVMGIFHMNVPAIAGGDINISKQFIPLAIEGSKYSGELSRYPLNNLVYSDLLYKLGRKDESCQQLKAVAGISETDIENMDNGMVFETRQNIASAKGQLVSRKCSK